MNTIARIEGLSVAYKIRSGMFGANQSLRAVDGVSLELKQGEILAIVGESGCGKSSLGKAIIRLIEPTSGAVEIDGVDFLSLQGRALRNHRSHIQMVFQDPYASLDPRMTVADILAEPLRAHGRHSAAELASKISAALSRVGLRPQDSKRYPHEFSGGQRQRVAIARALILEPKIIIADEPVSSLDVSVQAQILNLLRDIQREMNLTMVFISHNLAVVKYLADRIAVMYLGKIVEMASREELFSQPQHPYTQALLAAVPIPDPLRERARRRVPLKGEIPSAVNPPSGCAFHTRCPLAYDRCRVETPTLDLSTDTERRVACFAVAKPRPNA
jgi:oligopeptide/dipeptide ABC transporter ATP-binding protein